MTHAARGTSLIDIAAILVCCCALGPTLVPVLDKPAELARRERDRQQVARLMVAMHKFATDTNGSYPLPSRLDVGNKTIAAPAATKDNTGNILSVLIFNGLITPEELVSPAEVNPSVRIDLGYEHADPSRAAFPDAALWDPGFAGTPIDSPSLRRTPGISNQSYTHILPFGRRAAQWRTNAAELRPVVGNRGPQYATNDSSPRPASGIWSLLNGPTGVGSNTLRIHGLPNIWEGHLAFNDLHVEYWQTPTQPHLTYRRGAGSPLVVRDNPFVNESDEANGDSPGRFSSGRNTYMRPIGVATGQGVEPSTISVWRD